MKNGFDKKIFLIAAVAVLLATGLIWLAFFGQFGKIKELSDDIQKEQLNYSVKQERSQKILELGKELEGIETREKEMKAMLVDKEDAVPFLKLLEDIAIGTGSSIKISVADLSKIKSQDPKKPIVQEADPESTKDLQKQEQTKKTEQTKSAVPDFSNQLGFSVELTGKYGSLSIFTKLENLPYFVRVYNFQTVSIAKSQAIQTAGSGTVTTGDLSGQSNLVDAENQNTKSTIIIGVYINGK